MRNLHTCVAHVHGRKWHGRNDRSVLYSENQEAADCNNSANAAGWWRRNVLTEYDWAAARAACAGELVRLKMIVASGTQVSGDTVEAREVTDQQYPHRLSAQSTVRGKWGIKLAQGHQVP